MPCHMQIRILYAKTSALISTWKFLDCEYKFSSTHVFKKYNVRLFFFPIRLISLRFSVSKRRLGSKWNENESKFIILST